MTLPCPAIEGLIVDPDEEREGFELQQARAGSKVLVEGHRMSSVDEALERATPSRANTRCRIHFPLITQKAVGYLGT